MEFKKKLLNETSGFSLIELILVVLVFSISIQPIYRMIVTSANMQKTSEETFEATLQAQSILHSVKKQMEKDIKDEYRYKRGLWSGPVKGWIDPQADNRNLNPSLKAFLNNETEEFRRQFKTRSFLYEVHIWHVEDGQVLVESPVSFVAYDKVANPGVDPPSFDEEKPEAFTMVEIEDRLKDYFGHKEDALLWTNPDNQDPAYHLEGDPKAVGEITYDPTLLAGNQLKIRGSGIKSSIGLVEIAGYKRLTENTALTCRRYPDGPSTTYELLIAEEIVGSLDENDNIYLSLDLATFPGHVNEIILRVENTTKATLVMPVYNERNEDEKPDVKIFPIQHKTGGNIIIENRQQRAPSKNFVIGVIVRDAFNSGFGDPHKVLSKMVDIYSYDYNEH